MTDDWQKLNAYVDGTATPQDAADVAAQAATDRETAKRLAALQALKAELSEVELATTDADLLPATERRPDRRLPYAAVASLMILIIGLGVLYLMPFGTSESKGIDRAIAAFDAESSTIVGEPTAQTVAAPRLTVAGHDLPVPDLTAMRLSLARISGRGTETAPLHLDYRGRNGCRLSLFLLPATTEATAEPVVLRSGRVTIWDGSAGGVRYFVIVDRMAPDRATLALDAIHRQIVTSTAADEALRSALSTHPSATRPCVA